MPHTPWILSHTFSNSSDVCAPVMCVASFLLEFMTDCVILSLLSLQHWWLALLAQPPSGMGGSGQGTSSFVLLPVAVNSVSSCDSDPSQENWNFVRATSLSSAAFTPQLLWEEATVAESSHDVAE